MLVAVSHQVCRGTRCIYYPVTTPCMMHVLYTLQRELMRQRVSLQPLLHPIAIARPASEKSIEETGLDVSGNSPLPPQCVLTYLFM